MQHTENLVEVNNLTFKRGERVIYDNLNLQVQKGKVTAIMGPSGIGKTTLLRLIGGQLVPESGEILFDGQNVCTAPNKTLYQIRQRMGMLFQSGALFTDLSTFDNVAYPIREHTNLPEELIQKSGLSYRKRSQFAMLEQTTQVLLGDTMGEMMVLYGLAEIAFVGGSLVKHGGHNPLEPIAFELPVISGVHTYNFPEIFAKLRSVHGVVEVESSEEALAQAVAFLLENTNAREKIARYGFEVLKENQGALARHLHLLAPYLEK